MTEDTAARKVERRSAVFRDASIEANSVSLMPAGIVEAVGSDHLRLIMDAVNHFGSIQDVYHSSAFLNCIFDAVGPLAPVAHLKDVKVSPGLVVHIDQEVPGEGELDLALMLQRFDALFPEGYGLIEHLPREKVPVAAANIRSIAAHSGVDIH